MSARSVTVSVDALPWSMNEQVRWHPFERASRVREWRALFAAHARAAGIAPMGRVIVEAQTTVPARRRRFDAGNDAAALKAAVDGLVDAGVIAGDDPAHVVGVILWAPRRGTRARFSVTLTEVV